MRLLLRSLFVLVMVPILGLALFGVAQLSDWRPSLSPVEEKTIDRTGPSVLQSLTELSEYHAASAHYETVVDIEKDTSHLPSWVSGERVLYVAKGDVDGVVDFGVLDAQSVQLADDGTSAEITLPAPTVGEPVLDLENSYVADHDKGLVTKFKDSDLQQEVQRKAMKQMTAAATGEHSLTDLAEENTTAMLQGLLGGLGYTDVTVIFEGSAS